MSERYVLTIEPTPQGPPAMQRIKLLAKSMLRRFGLRIVDIRQDAGDTAPEPQTRRQLPLEVARAGTDGRHNGPSYPETTATERIGRAEYLTWETLSASYAISADPHVNPLSPDRARAPNASGWHLKRPGGVQGSF